MNVELVVFGVLWFGLIIGVLFFFKGAQQDEDQHGD